MDGCSLTIVMAVVYRPNSASARRKFRPEMEIRQRLRNDPDEENPEDTPPYLGEKRGSMRRSGNPVSVFLANDIEGARPFRGKVLDRSTTGVRLLTTSAVDPGSVLRVRAENAPDTTPWVYIQVCRTKPAGKNAWEIGCRFSQTPPWSILLLFG